MTKEQLEKVRKNGPFKGVRDMVKRIKEIKGKEVQN